MSVDDHTSVDGLILHSYVAVSYTPKKGAGIGIVQQACRPEPEAGIIDHRIPKQEIVYGWSKRSFATEGIETHKRCYLKSLVYALSNLRRLYKASGGCKMPRKVMIHSMSSHIVETIALHREAEWWRPRRPLDQDDRKRFGRVLRQIRRLQKLGPEISIVRTKSNHPAAIRADKLSQNRRRGTHTKRRSRHRKPRLSSNTVTGIPNEEEERSPISDSINTPDREVQQFLLRPLYTQSSLPFRPRHPASLSL